MNLILFLFFSVFTGAIFFYLGACLAYIVAMLVVKFCGFFNVSVYQFVTCCVICVALLLCFCLAGIMILQHLGVFVG